MARTSLVPEVAGNVKSETDTLVAFKTKAKCYEDCAGAQAAIKERRGMLKSLG